MNITDFLSNALTGFITVAGITLLIYIIGIVSNFFITDKTSYKDTSSIFTQGILYFCIIVIGIIVLFIGVILLVLIGLFVSHIFHL